MSWRGQLYSWSSQRQQVHAFRQGAAKSFREETLRRHMVVVADGLAVRLDAQIAVVVGCPVVRCLSDHEDYRGRGVPKALARPQAKTIKTTKTKNSGTLGMTYAAFALSIRLATQYFLMRRLTAFLAAADIFVRLRTGLAPFVFARRPGRDVEQAD